MDARIRLWIELGELAKRAHEAEVAALEVCQEAPFPWKTRPATPDDIRVGQIIWYAKSDIGPCFHRVREVYHPDDAFKAYCSHDGCRYGLDGAYVECDEPTKEL
jgi:hypothetical protein